MSMLSYRFVGSDYSSLNRGRALTHPDPGQRLLVPSGKQKFRQKHPTIW
jgi:hypothetical protein